MVRVASLPSRRKMKHMNAESNEPASSSSTTPQPDQVTDRGLEPYSKPTSVVEVNDADKKDVLLALLEQDREEIRFWHEKMFQASFALDTAMVAVSAFALQEAGKPDKDMLSLAACAGVIMFAVFHQIVGKMASTSICINGRDVEFIQAALRLSDPGEYVENKAVYAWVGKEWKPEQALFIWLHRLNVFLAAGLIAILLFSIALK